MFLTSLFSFQTKPDYICGLSCQIIKVVSPRFVGKHNLHKSRVSWSLLNSHCLAKEKRTFRVEIIKFKNHNCCIAFTVSPKSNTNTTFPRHIQPPFKWKAAFMKWGSRRIHSHQQKTSVQIVKELTACWHRLVFIFNWKKT